MRRVGYFGVDYAGYGEDNWSPSGDHHAPAEWRHLVNDISDGEFAPSDYHICLEAGRLGLPLPADASAPVRRAWRRGRKIHVA